MKNIKLSKLYLNVINEATATKTISDQEMDNDVTRMIKILNGIVELDNMQEAYNLLYKYANSNRGKEFLASYYESGAAKATLRTTLKFIFTYKPKMVRLKKSMFQLIDLIETGKTLEGDREGNENGQDNDLSKIDFNFDDGRSSEDNNTQDGGGGTTPPPVVTTTEPNYRDCKDLTDDITYGCINPMVAKIQKCKGITPAMGYFGPKTRRALGVTTITKEMFNTIMAQCPESTKVDTSQQNVNSEPQWQPPSKDERDKISDYSRFYGTPSDGTEDRTDVHNKFSGDAMSDEDRQNLERLSREYGL